MITTTYLTLEIEGKKIQGCLSLELSQPINGHHFFRAYFNGADVEGTPECLGEDSLKKIGKILSFAIQNDHDDVLDFKGIITSVHVEMSGNSSQGEMIVFEGFSPTILLDNGPACYVYANMNLDDIANAALIGIAHNVLKLNVNPLHSDELAYSVQYNESNFSFLNRMASRYGEWFYYDGKELVLGSKEQPSIDLIYGSSLINFNVSMLASAAVHEYAAHSYTTNETHFEGSDKRDPSVRGVPLGIHKRANDIWTDKKPAMNFRYDDSKSLSVQIHKTIDIDISGSAANNTVLRGSSINPALFPGATIKIKNSQGRDFGTYILTEVHHQFRADGNYGNNFAAVPVCIVASPNTNTKAFPVAESQPAVVTDNADPKGLGRVKVKFYWQKDTETQWLRIVMPYTGSDKGMYFIPENGEEVMVAFEGGNAERPYVIGSLYHGSAKADGFKNADNDIKAIKTRSGHTIELNDKSGGEKITIKDKEGNTIVFDTAKKELTITSADKMNINAKEINIRGDNKISISSKQISVSAQSKVEIESDANMTLTTKIFELSSTKSSIKGTMVDVAGDAITNVKGGLLNLN